MATEASKDRLARLGILKDVEALLELTVVARAVLEKTQKNPYERTLRYLATSLVNSSASVATLCTAGHGVDAVKIARSMFETHICFRYLLTRPDELRDFIDFDAIARYKRLQFWKTKMPQIYAGYSPEKIDAANHSYVAIKDRFMDSTGKVRVRWCRHGLAEMARVGGLELLYDLFYRHASSLHHTDPMGLAMLIDGRTLEIQPGPTERHLAIPMRIATVTLLDTLSEYAKLVGVDCSESFKRIDTLTSGVVDFQGSILGSLAEAFTTASESK
jgi:hypothetical protein